MPGGGLSSAVSQGSLSGSVVGGISNVLAAGKVAKGYRQAGEITGQEFERAQGLLQPYQQAGTSSLDQLLLSLGLPNTQGQSPEGRDFSAFYQSPGYQFRLGEGIKAVERSAASRGLFQSGKTIKDIQRFGEGLASEEYGRYTGLLAGLSQQGLSATGTNVALGQQAAAERAGYKIGQQTARGQLISNLGQTFQTTADLGARKAGSVLKGFGL